MSAINPGNFGLDHGGDKHQVWWLHLQEGETIDLPLDRAAWKTIIGSRWKVQMADTINVYAYDMSQRWVLFIDSFGPGWLKATMIEKTADPQVPELPVNCPLETKWNVGLRFPDGKCGGFDVIRSGDRAVLKSGFRSKVDAVAWIAEHVQSMSQAA